MVMLQEALDDDPRTKKLIQTLEAMPQTGNSNALASAVLGARAPPGQPALPHRSGHPPKHLYSQTDCGSANHERYIMNAKKMWLTLLTSGVVAGVCLIILIWRSPIARVASIETFDSAQVSRGAKVVEAGDCAVCHTPPGGNYLAGGLPLVTPFGTLYSTNITPDPETGIGSWSYPAFRRAMTEGISRDGHYLYPAFPYVHYRKMTDADLQDAYAYLMSGPQVHAPSRQNQMSFPMNIRPLVFFWNMLFLHGDPIASQPEQTVSWNRGRYLVEGAGHCAACHSPLNFLGGEASGKRMAGGIVDGWSAPSLLGMADSANPWTKEQLVGYLSARVVAGHGTPAGPMRPVSLGLANLEASEVQSIAEYLLSLKGVPSSAAPLVGEPIKASDQQLGAALFTGSCAGCHGDAAPMRQVDGRPALTQTSALNADTSRNFIKTVLEGVPPVPGARGPAMPPFANSLNNRQVAALAAYLRDQHEPAHPWADLSATLQELRPEAK
jgi:mono/diheme cytochrome c family protein